MSDGQATQQLRGPDGGLSGDRSRSPRAVASLAVLAVAIVAAVAQQSCATGSQHLQEHSNAEA